MSLRARLTLLYLVIAFVGVASLGTIAYFVARSATLNSVDDTLEANVMAVESSFEHLGGPITEADITQSRMALDRQAVGGLIYQIRDPSGAILYSSVGNSALSDSEVIGSAPGFQTVNISGNKTRVLILPVIRIGETIGSIEVRGSLAQAYASIAATRNVLIVGGALVVLLSAGVAFLVADRAARPVEALARLADEIEQTADFTRRLPEQPSPREMREMALTFNRMIARVEAMVDAQRNFLSDTSHELRRPLTILRTDIDILTDAGLSQSDLAAVQVEMRSAATSMSSLVTELLILARQDRDALNIEELDFSALCRSVVQDVASLYSRHSFELHAPHVILVEGDRQRLERMISNVLLNAAAYTVEPGVIECSLTFDGGVASLVIRDTGPGMTRNELEHIFDRFYRGETGRRHRPEGSGLGLPIVQQIAVSHGGSVSITSEPGPGTTVTIRVPARRTALGQVSIT